jgi:glycosyltransferase involved in cell wall biosynthesis
MVGNKPKITLITNADFPYGKSGENFTRNIALGLAESDASIDVVKYRGRMFPHTNDTGINSSNYLFKNHPKNGLLKGIQIILNSLYTPFFVLYRKLFKKDKVFVIFALKYAYELLPLLFWTKIVNIKIYQVIADHYSSNSIVPVWWKKPKFYAYKFQRKYLDRYFNGIVVLSNFLKSEALKNQVPEKKLLLLPHFIVFPEVQTIKSSQQEKRIICYCGTLSIDNGILDLIKAFQLLLNSENYIELRLVGGYSESLMQEIEQDKLNTRSVVFTGFVDKTQVENEILQSQVLVNPRRGSDWAEAGFPTKIGEYFASKKPVITTAVGDLVDYFKDKQEVVFASPNNPESLAESILFVLNNTEKANEIGLHGYHWANEHLDYKSNGKKMLEFIENN